MNEEGAAPTQPGATQSTPNLVQRVIMVFTSPGKLGEVLRPAAPWFWTLAIVAIVGGVAFILLPRDVLEQMVEMRMRGQSQAQAPDMDTAVTMARYFGSGAALVMTFVAAFIIAGVVLLVFNVALGQEVSYKEHLSAVAHMYWINTLGFLLLIPIWISKGDMQITLGFGLLLPDAPSSFVGHLLNSITLFGLWASVALGLIESGLSGGRVKPGKAVTIILILYAVWVLMSAVRGTMFGG